MNTLSLLMYLISHLKEDFFGIILCDVPPDNKPIWILELPGLHFNIFLFGINSCKDCKYDIKLADVVIVFIF